MSQKIIYGADDLAQIVSRFNKPLLVHEDFYNSFSIKNILDAVPHSDFTQFSSNPLYEDVCKGVDLFKNENCDAIIVVGGGSAIDVAKCIKLFCKMNPNINYLEQEKKDTGIELIAIPTTAGTGSESTKHAVIYYEGNKQSISHDSIVPNCAILIPELLEGLPVYQKKCTMLDALCQAVESWWSVNSTDESKEFSKRAIQLIRENWEDYIINNSKKAAEGILKAANFAGQAINITATTAAHAMSYKITSMYNFPHGHAVAVCLSKVWEYMLSHFDGCTDARGVEYLKQTMNEIEEYISLKEFNALLEKMQMNYPKSAHKANDSEILAASVNPVRLKNNPVYLSTEVLKEMYGGIIQ